MLKQIEKGRLENFAKKLLKDDYDKFDIQSEMDSSLSYGENKQIIREKIFSLYDVSQPIDKGKLQEQEIKEQIYHQELLLKEEEKAEKEFMKSLKEIEKDKSSEIIEQIYYVPKSFAKMVARKNSNGLLLYGKGGFGKTYSVIRAFKEEREEFEYCSGFTSILEFYTYLYNNKDKHIIFDDVSNLLKNPTIVDLMKSALYSPKGKRIVQYQSSSPRLKVPHKFEFTGTITILINEFKKSNEDLRAVSDRILSYELKIGYEDLIKIIFELSKQSYKDLKENERIKIARWIEKNTNSATRNLNLRLLFKIYEIYRYDKNNWEKLAEKIIENDKELLRLKKFIEENVTIKEAEKKFIEQGFGSRAKFYRLKRKL